MRNTFGYIPALMWWGSGRPFPWAPALPWAIVALLLMIPGLVLSIWSIVHMKKVGEGNPFDAYNHEVALLTLQVRSEEKRLEADFGDEYREYKKRVPRYIFHV